MHFSFSTTGHIIFGNGTIKHLSQHVKHFGNNAFIVCGKNPNRIKHIIDELQNSEVFTTIFHVLEEPTVPLVLQAIEKARSSRCDVVVGIGGGSVLDTGKVISAMLANEGELLDYLEVIGGGKKITNYPIPYIAVPTTAGTGAEVTSNAVIHSPERKVKVSMRSILMYPRVAIIDPELTYSMPASITASSGLDALTQLIEAYVSNKANPLTDGLCIEGLRRAARSLYRAYNDGDESAREDMCVASLCSGIALANAKLGAVHGLAAPLGGMLSAPHGMVCARLLPFVVEKNVMVLQEKSTAFNVLKRYDVIAQILTDSMNATATDGVQWIRNICKEMDIPALRKFGLEEKDIPIIAQRAKMASSTKGNPVELSENELTEILKLAL